MEEQNQLKATLTGVSALVFWALSPVIVSELHNIPTFQLSATVFFIAFLYTSMQLTRKKEWKKINLSVVVLLVGGGAILSNHAAYVYSLRAIPPEQAEIVYYIWPILVLMISGLFFEAKRSLLPVISALIGLSGIYIILTDGKGLEEISLDRSEGYFFALIAAGSWATYSLFNRFRPGIPLEMNGIWCGLAAVPSFAINYYFEGFVIPTLYQWALMTFLGVGTFAYSLGMWATGLRHGHFALLSTLSYLTPLLSVIFLIMAGKAEYKSSVLISCQLVIIGGAFCAIVDWIKIKFLLTPSES